jgi:hypothetical protein
MLIDASFRPGGASKAAWPFCVWQNNGATSLADAFACNLAGGCGNALPNVGPGHPAGGSVVQIKVTIDPITSLSKYTSRVYATGFSLVTGLGVAEDLGSLMVFSDQTGGVARQEVVTKLPLCVQF